MSWTDDRIELLRKLWQEGLSASTIAREMGGAITRNAVIGKVHRMGLAGRAKSPMQVPTRSKAKPIAGSSIGGGSAVSAKSNASLNSGRTSAGASMGARPSAPMVSGNNALAMALTPMIVPVAEPRYQPAEEVVIPISERVTLMELKETMCRWPLGDPTQQDFRFCGLKSSGGLGPYCGYHAGVAYQPAQDRRRDRDREKRALMLRHG